MSRFQTFPSGSARQISAQDLDGIFDTVDVVKGVPNGKIGNVGSGSWARTNPMFSMLDGGAPLYVVSPSANPAIVAFSRTSDSTQAGADSAWGFAALVLNDNVTYKQNARGLYFEPRRMPGTGSTYGGEINVINFGDVIGISPYVMGSEGHTSTWWLSSGRSDLGSIGTVRDTTCAIGLINNGTRFTKGIVIGNQSVAPSITGIGPEALAMPHGMTITWANPANAAAKAFITSTAVTASTAGQVGIIFTDAGGKLQSSDGGIPFDWGVGQVNINAPLVVEGPITVHGFESITGAMILTGLLQASDEMSAAAAGVPSHGVYRNGSVLQVRIT